MSYGCPALCTALVLSMDDSENFVGVVDAAGSVSMTGWMQMKRCLSLTQKLLSPQMRGGRPQVRVVCIASACCTSAKAAVSDSARCRYSGHPDVKRH